MIRDQVHYGQLVWMAVPVDEFPQRGKSIAATRFKPVVLSFLSGEDIDQGALLTQFDLAALLGVCDAVVSQYVNEIQKEGTLLPTRTPQAYSR